MTPVDHILGEIYDDGAPLDLQEPLPPPPDEVRWSTLRAGRIFDIAVAAMALKSQCESPIEVQLGAELKVMAGDELLVIPQFEWQRWRMDFAVLDLGMQILAFVECDGAEFHSTPAQLANDRRKDAAAKAANIPLFRFSGSEIFRHAGACAYIVLKAVCQ